VLGQLQKSSESLLVKHSALIVFTYFQVFFYYLMDIRRELVKYASETTVDLTLLSVFELLELSIARNEVCVEKLYNFYLEALVLYGIHSIDHLLDSVERCQTECFEFLVECFSLCSDDSAQVEHCDFFLSFELEPTMIRHCLFLAEIQLEIL